MSQDDEAREIIIRTLIVAILATIAVPLRLLSRRLQGMALHIDDYLIIIALVKPLEKKLRTCLFVFTTSSLLDGEYVSVRSLVSLKKAFLRYSFSDTDAGLH